MTRNPPEISEDLLSQAVPDYMQEVYDWAYVNPRYVNRLDHNWVVRVLLFGNDQRLMRAYLAQIQPGMKVWQVAHVYGDLVRRVALRVGAGGRFDLTDVTPIQVEHATHKLQGMAHARVIHADAARHEGPGDYDLIASFFLLHEVPDSLKHEIVDNMLRQLPEHGRAVFVDYHRPRWWQPIGWLLRWVNARLEPFAHALWQHEIQTYASEPERYTWSKRTVFGGVYQVVLVEHRA